jgi:tetratricopeptide (TPR) repeat protein
LRQSAVKLNAVRFVSPFLCLLLLCSLTPAWANNYLVLPFANASDRADLDWIGESLAESVEETFASEGFMVVSREDRIEASQRLLLRPQALLTRASVIRLAESLGADRVIFGLYSVGDPANANSDGSLRLSATMLDLRRSGQRQEMLESGNIEDLSSMQSHLVWQLLRGADPARAPGEEIYRRMHPSVRIDAIENYIRGLLNRTAEARVRYWQRAASLDARYPQPAFQLGKLYLEQENYALAEQWLYKVTPSSPKWREANFLLGVARIELDNFAGAEQNFEVVARQAPLNEVLNNLGVAQMLRNSPAALESFRRAVEGDPNDPDYHFNLGLAFYLRREPRMAVEEFRAVLARDPEDEDATAMLGRCLKEAQGLGPGQKPSGPQASVEGLERVKTNYEERAWLQLKLVLSGAKGPR